MRVFESDSVGDGDDLVGAAYPQLQSPSTVKFAHGNDPVAPMRGHALQSGIKNAFGARTALVECESVRGVQNDGHAREPGCQTSNETGLRCVSVNRRVAFVAQKAVQMEESIQIPQRTNFAPDYVDIDRSNSVLFRCLPENSVGGQQVDVPALGPHGLGQPQDDLGRAAEA